MIVIYRLLNYCNYKGYVGQTALSLKQRWYNGKGYKGCTYIHNAINKYGANNFYYDILMIIENNDVQMERILADYWEDYYINIFDYKNPEQGYNLRDGGNGGNFSDETKKKMSMSKIGKYIGAENPNFGNHWTDEQKKIASDRMQGLMDGENNRFFGKTHTEENKKKMSEIVKLNHKLGKYNDKNERSRKFTKEEEKEIVEKILNTNITREELLEIYDMSISVLDRLKSQYNIEVKRKPVSEEHKAKLQQSVKKALLISLKNREEKSLKLQEEVIKLREQGLLQREIAEILNIKQVRVSQILIKSNMRTEIKSKRKKSI